MKVIFDTDPGVDDAMALYYALAHPSIEVVGITTVFGNVTVTQATANALYLCGLTQCDAIPVAAGAARPLHKTLRHHPRTFTVRMAWAICLNGMRSLAAPSKKMRPTF